MNDFYALVDYLKGKASSISSTYEFTDTDVPDLSLFLRIETADVVGDINAWDVHGTCSLLLASLEKGDIIYEKDPVDWKNSDLETVFRDFFDFFKISH